MMWTQLSGWNPGHGSELNNFVTTILILALRFLWLVFIISLIVGLVMFVKNRAGARRVNQHLGQDAGNGYVCPCCSTRLTADFRFCPNCKASLKDICMSCGKELQAGWRCCPICGAPKRVR